MGFFFLLCLKSVKSVTVCVCGNHSIKETGNESDLFHQQTPENAEGAEHTKNTGATNLLRCFQRVSQHLYRRTVFMGTMVLVVISTKDN